MTYCLTRTSLKCSSQLDPLLLLCAFAVSSQQAPEVPQQKRSVAAAPEPPADTTNKSSAKHSVDNSQQMSAASVGLAPTNQQPASRYN